VGGLGGSCQRPHARGPAPVGGTRCCGTVAAVTEELGGGVPQQKCLSSPVGRVAGRAPHGGMAFQPCHFRRVARSAPLELLGSGQGLHGRVVGIVAGGALDGAGPDPRCPGPRRWRTLDQRLAPVRPRAAQGVVIGEVWAQIAPRSCCQSSGIRLLAPQVFVEVTPQAACGDRPRAGGIHRQPGHRLPVLLVGAEQVLTRAIRMRAVAGIAEPARRRAQGDMAAAGGEILGGGQPNRCRQCRRAHPYQAPQPGTERPGARTPGRRVRGASRHGPPAAGARRSHTPRSCAGHTGW